MIDVQTSEKPGTKAYDAVAQAIDLARRPEGVRRAELIKLPGGNLSRWGTRMAHHPAWPGKGYAMISAHLDDGEWHFRIVPICELAPTTGEGSFW
jgi:hypothetical protein